MFTHPLLYYSAGFPAVNVITTVLNDKCFKFAKITKLWWLLFLLHPISVLDPLTYTLHSSSFSTSV